MPIKKLIRILIFIFLFCICGFFYAYSENNSQFNQPLNQSPYLTSPERTSVLKPEAILRTLNVKLGMTILDTGAGKGLFSFLFAKALKNTGKVFATDVDPAMIEYIKDKIKNTPYTNIVPMQVQKKGLDSFYRQHTFDIIFICETFSAIWSPQSFFYNLRYSLVKDTGRLYIIDWGLITDFQKIDFQDFRDVIKILIAKGHDFPVFKRLDKEVQDFIKNWQGNDVPPEIQTKIVQDFNKILLDKFLLYDLVDYFINKGFVAKSDEWSKPVIEIIDHGDIGLIKWLIIHLDRAGVFDKKERILTATEKEQLFYLNKILLKGMFGLNKSAFLLGETSVGPPILDKNSVISKMTAAGYIFVREYNILSQHYFLEFKRSN